MPAPEIGERARTRLAQFAPDAEEVTADTTDKIQYIDCGQNLEAVGCPLCNADVIDWWLDWMTDAYNEGFTDLQATFPCCNGAGSLQDLVFDWPAGFARFELSAMNPNLREFTAEQIREIEAIVGQPLRQIRQHI